MTQRMARMREAAEFLIVDTDEVLRILRSETDNISAQALVAIAEALAAYLRYTATVTLAGLDMAEGLVPDGR